MGVSGTNIFGYCILLLYSKPKDNMTQLPDPLTSIAPMLSVRKGTQAIEFYKAAFGATVLFRIEDPSGAVVAQLTIGTAQFWVADESPEHANFSPESLNGGTVRMLMTVQDPDSSFDRAIEAGAISISPMADHHYGWRVGRVADPYGHHWEIGKPLEPTQ